MILRRGASRVKHFINNDEAISYSYDTAGNISSIQNPDGSYVEYTYDDLNQLIGEHYSLPCVKGGDSPSTDSEGLSYDQVSYEYDGRGNITEKTYSLNGETVDTVTYGYTDTTWADRLTAFDGVSISYDAIGNPLNWTNGATLSWQHGRQLASYTKDGTSISYTYNQDGIRTSKTVNGVITQYTVTDGTLRRMTSGENTLEFINNTSVLFDDAEYWYVFNAQNDVIGLIDANGNYVVEYTYDAWGNPLSKTGSLANTLGTLNPFRYRGYIYDEETGFYYVSSRYYDPVIGRFLNADDVAVATVTPETPHWDKNLYAYCDNNPVIRIDADGEFWGFIGAAVGAVVGGVVSAVSQGIEKGFNNIDWGVVVVDAASGAISGAVASTGIGFMASVGVNAALGGTTYVAEQVVKGEAITVEGIVTSTVAGGISGAIGGSGANSKGLSEVYKSASSSIKRELRRANVNYATKQIAKYTIEKKAVIHSACTSIVRFVLGAIGNADLRSKFGY